MRPDEALRLAAFLAVVASVFSAAALALLRWALKGRRPGALGKAALACAALGAACIAYGYFVEPYRLEATHVRLESPKLDRTVRLLLLSDAHSDPKARLEPRLPEEARRLAPDLIVFTGDAINSPEGLPVFKKLLTGLAAVAPTYVVRGNWDAWHWRGLDLFGGTGAVELDGRAPVRVGNLSLGGLDVRDAPDIRSALGPPDTFRVFAHHYPDFADDASVLGADLYLAGHTHGGQVALPFYGAIITLSSVGKRFEAGLYEVGSMRLYVSRGLGMEGGRTLRVRFCARPELTLLELVPAR